MKKKISNTMYGSCKDKTETLTCNWSVLVHSDDVIVFKGDSSIDVYRTCVYSIFKKSYIIQFVFSLQSPHGSL